MAYPGLVLQGERGPQIIENDLSLNVLTTKQLVLTNAVNQAEFVFVDGAESTTQNISYGPDLTFPNCIINSSLRIGTIADPKNLTITQKTTSKNLICEGMFLEVLESFGSKTDPIEDTYNAISMLGYQNKLFFKYTDPAEPGVQLTVQNPLLRTGMIYLKDITGTRDIPGASVILGGLDAQYPYVNISGIPADPDGYARGMLLII